jgi:predicted transcriptional regulator with HTH domain
MPPISQQKKEKITEQVLFYLYQEFPKSFFTAEIARELARDEEFIKDLLIEIQKKDLIIKITKNPQGIKYLKRTRWRLSNKVHDIYKQKQSKN